VSEVRRIPTTSRHCRSDAEPPARYHATPNPRIRDLDPALDLQLVESTVAENEQVDLQGARHVDQIERRVHLHRDPSCIHGNVELRSHSLEQARFSIRREQDRDVDVYRRARLPEQRTGERTAECVRDVEVVEDLCDFADEVEGTLRHSPMT
jgi:hypothetical protein